MKRYLLIALATGAAAVFGGRWYARLELVAERRAEAANGRAVEAALARSISTDAISGRQKLHDILLYLAANCPVPLKIARTETEPVAPLAMTRVEVPSGERSIEQLLNLVLDEQAALAWHRLGGAIVITSRDQALPAPTSITRVYPLPASTGAGDKLTDDAEEMAELIKRMIEPDSWEEVGGSGLIEVAGGTIIVRHAPQIQTQIESFLSRMAKLPASTPQFPLEDYVLDEEKIERRLDALDSVKFTEVPLREVIEGIRKRHELPIRINQLSLKESGLSLDAKVTCGLSNVSLRTILTEILAGFHLNYEISGDEIVIAVGYGCSAEIIWFYDVRELVETESGSDFDSLIDVLTTTVQPESWEDVGGSGIVAELGGGWVVVNQTPEAHQAIQRLLARLRALLEPGVDPAADALLEPIDDLAPAIEEALDREVTLKYEGLPLGDVCRDLSRQLAIPVLPRMRPDSTTALDAPVTIDLPPLPLRDALALLLAEHQLTFDPRGEVLYITTPEDAESNLVTRIIDVRHLVDPASGGFDEDMIIDLVTSCVQPDMWDEVGGPGRTEIFRGLLVFNQTYDVSRKVQELIEALSEHCLPQPLDGAPAVATARSVWVGLSDREREIVERLDRRDSLQLNNPKVEETIRAVCERHAIPVLFGRELFEPDDVPWQGTNVDMDNVPLHDILNALARIRGGRLSVARGVLVVGGEEWRALEQRPRLYRTDGIELDAITLMANQVADRLVERLEPDAWSDNGGYGIILPVGDNWLLVVQTLPMHGKVEAALEKLSRGETLPPPMP